MRLGVFIIGIKGNVASSAVVGARALAHGLIAPTGLVSLNPELAGLDLTPIEALRFGGCDVAEHSLLDAARRLGAEGVIPPRLLEPLAPDLVAIEALCCPALALPGPDADPGAPLSERIAVTKRRFAAFAAQAGVDALVVVNLAPTEAYRPPHPAHAALADLQAAIAGDDREAVSTSIAYAYAALDAGHAYLNFTPSVGASLPALEALARARGVPHAGQDGKTGETLLKTVLAPMFLARRLCVLAWEGRNFLGNNDGRTLEDPRHRETKLRQKDAALGAILGAQEPRAHVHTDISYTPSLGDFKTAWDFIHFRGFLDVPMTLQLTWQGCDSALAAPLVIDLARFVAHAHARGEVGALPYLASFFKKPLGTDEQDFFRQYAMLREYAAEVRAEPSVNTSTRQ